MTNNHLALFYLIDRESTSKALSIKIPSSDSIDNLKKLIKKKKTTFKISSPDKLTLWRVSIPVVPANKLKPGVLKITSPTTELDPDRRSPMPLKKHHPRKQSISSRNDPQAIHRILLSLGLSLRKDTTMEMQRSEKLVAVPDASKVTELVKGLKMTVPDIDKDNDHWVKSSYDFQ
ncbi:hypothetical protein EC957_000509 [Mortierella hygrophila]|uniref:Crinkler effector protein N-terminal domain-containing protein n=1 Tax=Mortierella hygrophila TaxID=979708 RepID=A0A9P6F7J2_9FUNG|nr:hypothetical protein EC957_000509 [Mortierella hygrophila]